MGKEMSFIKRIYWKFRWLTSIRLMTYIYLNYFCRKVTREPKAKIIPYKGAVINLGRDSRILLKGKNLEIGVNRLRGSRTETLIRLERGGILELNNGAQLTYGTTIEVKENAHIMSSHFFMNVGSAMVCAKKITIGDDVWMGRGVIIYDSDFHRLLNEKHEIRNYPEEVVIDNHVWLTNQIMVQKGVHIEEGSVIAPYSLIRNDIPPHSMVVNGSMPKTVKDDILWSSELI